jgi:DNA-binding response OmpR family regulator
MKVEGQTILLLEDEPIIGFALEDMLIDRGAKPLFCGTLEAARSTLESAQPDVAILDVNIHGERSYPVAEVLARRGIPFIFATGYGNALHPPQFAKVPTISKPYRLPEVEQALAALSGPGEGGAPA